MKKVILLYVSLFLITSCVSKVALSPEYWKTPSKVGVFVNVNKPHKFKEGSQGLLDMAVTSGDKYQEALDLIGQQIQPKDELVNLYSDILKSKGKEIVIVNETFDPKTAQKFKGNKQEGKKYSVYDFSNLKDKYNIDELLFINVDYGFMISYYGMIETGKSAYFSANTNLINLADQSLALANFNAKSNPLKKWKDNNYEASVNGVNSAYQQVKELEKTAVLK